MGTELSISRLITHFARTKPDELALVEDGAGDPADRSTWAELDRETNALARAYAERGVGQDSMVAVSLPNSAEFVRACVAIWKLGGTPLPLSVKLPAIERDRIVALAEPALLLGAESGDVPSLPRGFDATGYDDSELPDRVSTYWKALTSGGSTGLPEDHRGPGEGGLRPGRCRWSTTCPPAASTWSPGRSTTTRRSSTRMRAFFSGSRLVVMPRFDAARVLTIVDEQRVTWIQLVPTMMNRIWHLPAEQREAVDWSSLLMLLHVGGPCAPWLKEAFIDWLGPSGSSRSTGAPRARAPPRSPAPSGSRTAARSGAPC